MIVPIGVIATPQDDVVQVAGDALVAVDDLHLLPAPDRPSDPMDVDLVEERVVEGHTTFVTLEATANNSTVEGNITIDGFVDCQHHAEEHHGFFGPIPIPSSVENVYVECHVGEQVIITPTIYCTLTGNPGCTTNAQAPIFIPTGHVAPFTVAGQEGLVTEYVFQDGGQAYYAWSVPILEDHYAEDAHVKNLYIPLPRDRLADMGIADFKIVYLDRVAHL